MISKATDAVSKMTIKMNESDVVSSAVGGHSWRSQLFPSTSEHFRKKEISQIHPKAQFH